MGWVGYVWACVCIPLQVQVGCIHKELRKPMLDLAGTFSPRTASSQITPASGRASLSGSRRESCTTCLRSEGCRCGEGILKPDLLGTTNTSCKQSSFAMFFRFGHHVMGWSLRELAWLMSEVEESRSSLRNGRWSCLL